MSDDRLILMPDFGERAAWTLWDSLNFTACDLCVETELSLGVQCGDFGKMYWDYDGIVVCEVCKDKGEHLKEAA